MAERQRLVGTVRGLASRTEVYGGQNGGTSSLNVLTFRLDPTDGTRPVSVQLRGPRLTGGLVEGEQVHVVGRFQRDGTFHAKQVISQETGATIDGRYPLAAKVIGAVLAVAVAAGLAYAGGQALFEGDDPAVSVPGDGGERTPAGGSPSADPASEFREKARQECLDDPNLSDDQCEFVYG